MTILSSHHNPKYIFVHIIKTAGMSVRNKLKTKTKNAKDISHHGTIMHYHEKNISLDDYFKFCFVRNPWDKMVSQYYYLEQQKNSHPLVLLAKQAGSFDNWVNSYIKNGYRVTVFPYLHFPYMKDPSGNMRVDFVGRFEKINEDWDFITNKLKIVSKLPTKNSSKRSRDYKEYYTETSKKVIETIFKEEIEYFGYKF